MQCKNGIPSECWHSLGRPSLEASEGPLGSFHLASTVSSTPGCWVRNSPQRGIQTPKSPFRVGVGIMATVFIPICAGPTLSFPFFSSTECIGELTLNVFKHTCDSRDGALDLTV